ncbi:MULTISPECIES: LacI family DNA-binding transcriptional regulator [unclassified Microbacterium]|uniref:LacI family DNA-binding transcriptional regulator n=1 Tax=unclassified Microbacterium TaxID=2609290 RepID=UPI00214B4A52|nr:MULTISPECIES: LacI family DNA-binding transcriptional regulator [unclassified Microbacterium]MCR2783614.1 LacI family DNA-binding transcriptional regulator [Microbacterium sp. zg.B96]WIM15527.1 LacI family DNA-binding transcriptional regulator [Microbacterium sp. zg-B96]
MTPDMAPLGGAPTESRRPSTIYDVATAAGVSHQTVSRLLKGYEGIRPETRAKVVQALEELDYRPNLTARSLKSGRSHRIAAFTHEASEVGPSRIAEGASAAARDAGYVLDLVFVDMHSPAAIEQSLELLTRHAFAGVLALASSDAMLRALAEVEFGVPVQLETEAATHSSFSETATTALVEHLASLGHRRLLHMAGPMTWSAARGRQHAYETATAHLGLESAGALHGDWSAGSGYRAVAELTELPDATAYVVANDQMALGVMLALKERGLRVPDDVSVVGVDDIPEAAYFDPPLTTVRNDFDATGRAAVQRLIARIEGAAPPPAPRRATEVIVRRSSAPAPAPDPAGRVR